MLPVIEISLLSLVIHPGSSDTAFAVHKNFVKKPRDLHGKKVGVQLHTMTAAVSIRGLLQQADVDLSSIAWAEGALEKPGSHGVSSAKPLLKRVKRVRNETNQSLSQLLEMARLPP